MWLSSRLLAFHTSTSFVLEVANKVFSVVAVCTALTRLNETQQQANALADICSDCNGSLEDAGSFAREEVSSGKGKKKGLSNPMANCICIDCPITYKRHRLREYEIEAIELCKALNI